MEPRDIVLIANEPWEHFTWRRRHHVAWALARKHRVLFVEPPLTLLSPILARFKQRHIDWKQILNLGRLKCQGRNLYSYCPVKILPLSLPLPGRDRYDNVNRMFVFSALARVARRLKLHRPILWTYFSMEQYEYYGLFGEVLRVTDYYDKFTAPFGWEGPPEHRARIEEVHRRLIEAADVVFAASKALYDDVKAMKPASYHIPHGVDLTFYGGRGNIRHEVIERLKQIRRPILGYLGSVQHKIDFGLLRYVAEAHPEWSVVLVGKVVINNERDRDDWAALTGLENVWHFGGVERQLIPAVLARFDVCLVPFKRIEWCHYAAAPLKVWEYVAADKPIVAIDQDAADEFGRAMNVVDDAVGFVKAVEAILADGEDERVTRERRALAPGSSWDHRVDQMMAVVEEHLARLGGCRPWA